MQAAFQPQIILLREGTDTSQGKAQIISNINACQAVAETVRTTLGPRGMDKLVFDGRRTTISNDGATIMRLLDIVHPAAKTLVDISMAQDAEVGDGTTSVVLLAAEILKECKDFVEDGLHPRIIVRGLREVILHFTFVSSHRETIFNSFLSPFSFISNIYSQIFHFFFMFKIRFFISIQLAGM